MTDRRVVGALLHLSDLSLYISPKDVIKFYFRGPDAYLKLSDNRTVKIKNGSRVYKAHLITEIYNSVKGLPFKEFTEAVESLSIHELISLKEEIDSLPGDEKNKTLSIEWVGRDVKITPTTYDDPLMCPGCDVSALPSRIPYGQTVDLESLLEEREWEESLEDENYEPVRLLELGLEPESEEGFEEAEFEEINNEEVEIRNSKYFKHKF